MNIGLKKYKFIRNLALLFIAGNLIGWIFPFPNIIWRLGLVLLSIYVIVFEEKKRLPCENAILIFTAFNLVHYFVSFLWQNSASTQIGNILYALLPLSLFVYLSKKKVLDDRFITFAEIVLLSVAILDYYHTKNTIISSIGLGDDIDVVNNASVTFLMILPMLFLLKSNIQKWLSLLVCMFFLLMGVKRGNIFAAVIPIGLIIYSLFKNRRQGILKIILTFILLLVASYITYDWITSNDFLLYRVNKTIQGNSSGRDVIYTGAWHSWYDSNNIITYLFGYGFDATRHQILTMHRPAHNDWLEILVDYGLVGVLLYLAIFMTLLHQIKQIQSYKMKLLLLSAFIIWFFKSVYSMGFTEEALSILMISMGAALGEYKLEEQMRYA